MLRQGEQSIRVRPGNMLEPVFRRYKYVVLRLSILYLFRTNGDKRLTHLIYVLVVADNCIGCRR